MGKILKLFLGIALAGFVGCSGNGATDSRIDEAPANPKPEVNNPSNPEESFSFCEIRYKDELYSCSEDRNGNCLELNEYDDYSAKIVQKCKENYKESCKDDGGFVFYLYNTDKSCKDFLE